MTTVIGKVVKPDGTPDTAAKVYLELVGADPAVGFVGTTDTEVIGRRLLRPDLTGVWTATSVVANSLISPSDTAYSVKVHPSDGPSDLYYISVPAVASSYWAGDIQSTAPVTQPLDFQLGGTYTSAATSAFRTRVAGEAHDRLTIYAGNGMVFGDGTAAPAMSFALNAGGALQIGAGGDPNGPSQQVSLVAMSRIDNPNVTIMQHFVGYSLYTGTPGGSAGSLQGGSCQAQVYMSPANMGTALGFEGIVWASGDAARTLTTGIGLQGTAFASANTTTVTDLIAIRASGPYAQAGAPTVVNATSLDVQAPTVGTTRVSLKVAGRTRLLANGVLAPLEIFNSSGLLQWGTAVDGTALIGYASDGASARMRLDSSDVAPVRALFCNQGAGTIGLQLQGFIGQTGDLIQVTDFGGFNVFWSVGGGGIPRWDAVANQQTTVGAAGAASALPATPTKYLKVKDSAGTVLVIPCYAAA